MSDKNKCLVCGTNSDTMPLLEFEYKSDKIHVCAQHIPIIIHQHEKLKELLG